MGVTISTNRPRAHTRRRKSQADLPRLLPDEYFGHVTDGVLEPTNRRQRRAVEAQDRKKRSKQQSGFDT